MIAEELPSQPQPVDLRFNQLTAESYEELRCVAARYLQGERAEHTLQATALVHEAFLRLVRLKEIPWQNRAHLVALAAGAPRRGLLRHAPARVLPEGGGARATRP